MADTDIRALVESKAEDLTGLLSGSGLTLDRFKATVFQLWDRDHQLQSCTPNSVLAAVMAVADIGLTFTPNLGHAYLVKFGNSATPIVGYKGLMHLALRCGGALDFRAGVRRQADGWQFRPLHPTEPIVHEPADAPSAIVGYYAVAFLPGGFVRAEYMTKRQIEEHRDKYSKAKDSGPWKSQFDDMAMKTVVRRICKYLRIAGGLEKAVTLSERVDLETGEVLDPPLPDDLPRGIGVCLHTFNDPQRISLCTTCGEVVPITAAEVIGAQELSDDRKPSRQAGTAPVAGAPPPATPASPGRALTAAEQEDLMREAKKRGIKFNQITQILFKHFDGADGFEDLTNLEIPKFILACESEASRNG